MYMIDIVLGATYGSTAPILLPGGMPPIAWVPTTGCYLQGIAGFKDLTLTARTASSASFNKIGVAYNIVKLKYRATGELVRT